MARATLTLAVLTAALALPCTTPGEPPGPRIAPTQPLARLRYGERIRNLTFSPDSQLLAGCSDDRTIRLWEPRSGRVLAAWRHDELAQVLAFTPDRSALVLAGAGLHVRDLRGGWRRSSLNLPTWDGWQSACLSANGRFAAGVTFGGGARAWETATFRPTGPGLGRIAGTPAVSGDGHLLAAFTEAPLRAGRAYQLRLWVLTTGAVVRIFLEVGRPFDYRLAFAPGGVTLAVGGPDGVQLLNAETGRVLRIVRGSAEAVQALSFAANGRMLAVADESGAVRLIEVATGWERARVPAGPIQQTLALSPDGRVLAGGTWSGQVTVWGLRVLAGAGPPAQGDLDHWWADLAGEDGSRAYRSMWRLAAEPGRAVSDLRGRLSQAEQEAAAGERARAEAAARCVAALDSPRAAERDRASVELAKLGVAAELALRRLLAGSPSAEARRRAERLLDRLEGDSITPSPEGLRALRAVESLELMGTPDARRLLEELARGMGGAELTREAQAVLTRLDRLKAAQE